MYLNNTLLKFGIIFILKLGTTCYCNSVIQALYSCSMFRMDVIEKYQIGILGSQKTASSLYYKKTEDQKRYVMTYALGKLFSYMNFHKETISVTAPTAFIKTVGEMNSIFKDTSEQQDAHELINFIINRISEEGDDELESRKKTGSTSLSGAWSTKLGKSVVDKAFQGITATQICCMECRNSSLHTETFFDIPVDIPGSSSDTYTLVELLERMHEKELLRGQDKLYCEKCMCTQEAEKSMHYLKLPRTLIVQLKRFKFSEKTGNFLKLHHEIVYPLSLNMSVNSKGLGDFPQDKKSYQLQAVVVHIGSTPYGGHYVAVVRRFNKWFIHNDDRISLVDENVHSRLYGSKGGLGTSSACAYILIYSETPSVNSSENALSSDILLSSFQQELKETSAQEDE